MKNITLIFASLFLAVTIFSCNAKQENDITTDENDTDEIKVYEDFEVDGDTLKTDTTKDTSEWTEYDAEKSDTATSGKEPVMAENEDGSLKKVSENEIKKEEEKQKTEPKKVHVKKFYVIAGSFQEINNAVDLRAFLKTKGFPAVVLYPYRGYNRVAVQSFTTRNAAENKIKQVRTNKLSYKDEAIEYWLLWR